MSARTSTAADVEPVVSLTADEYLALAFAAEFLAARADDLVDSAGMSTVVDVLRGQATVLQRLHDRWHAASMLANEGRLHDLEACAWCRNGAER